MSQHTKFHFKALICFALALGIGIVQQFILLQPHSSSLRTILLGVAVLATWKMVVYWRRAQTAYEQELYNMERMMRPYKQEKSSSPSSLF